MKKLNLASLLLGAALFTGLGAVSLSASSKCGAGKCGGETAKPAKKCGDAKCGDAKKTPAKKWGASKCGDAKKEKKAAKCGTK